jgi:hypothetical protein
MDDYIYNIRELLQEVNIMDKRFYVVVPFFTEILNKKTIFGGIKNILSPVGQVTQTTVEFEQKKRELTQRTQIVASGLASMGIRAVLLNTQEIIEMLYNSYNIDESQNQAIGNVEDMATPVVGRHGKLGVPRAEAAEPTPDDLFAAANAAQATAIGKEEGLGPAQVQPPTASGGQPDPKGIYYQLHHQQGRTSLLTIRPTLSCNDIGKTPTVVIASPRQQLLLSRLRQCTSFTGESETKDQEGNVIFLSGKL